MILNLNFNHLYYFYIVGKANGLSEAARMLRISQPSLSAQMKVLEAKLGIALFRKVGRRLQLTPDGHRVFTSCEKMFSIAENLERGIDAEVHSHQIQIHVGVSGDIDRSFAVDVISRSFAKEKRVKVRFLSGSEEWLQRELQLGNFDFVLATQPLFAEQVRVLAEKELPIVAGIAKKLLGSGPKPKNLKDLPNRWVAPAPNQKLRKEMEGFLEKKRITPKVVFESDVMGALVRAITDGIGWGLFPKAYMRHEFPARSIVILGPKEGFWKHKIYLLGTCNSPHLSAYEKAFTSALDAEINA